MVYDIFQTENVHIDVDLTNYSVGWGTNKLIADLLFPPVPVAKQSDRYPVFGMENYIAETDVQGSKDYPKEVERTFERRSYACDRHALREFIADEERTNADDAMQSALEDMAVVAFLKEKVLLNKEVAAKTALSTTGSYASGLYYDLDATTNWDDTGGSALLQLQGLKDTIQGLCGVEPDTLVVASDCWPRFAADPSFFGGGAVDVTHSADRIREILGLDRVIKASARYSTEKPKKGAAVTLNRLWTSNSVWLLFSPQVISKLQPSTGKCFKWNATSGYVQGELVRSLRDEARGDGGTWFEYKQHYDLKLTAMNSSSKIITGAYLVNCYAAV